ncbi:Nif3-like dinuclear metal center hexameric protein [Xylanibacillus composti]|uniref:GTP cyclohydrolase 1 type 2 homolog n=1 Tax=Xylanibacillus composti TaxID=1572762 RepID=A0A8J4M1Z9_9BACL|nr:Nif3-like dinuclear metal center hexameric protein [Xylanibacillus composti]MDT9724405.1 Nif3-like dinuclear metal center hexameric protein [Xylanibacillus composti]GIQ68001.1 GTP cyclohydrolase 1 type 2 [Xylanibacillus composti]
MLANGQTVIQLMERWAPKRLAVPDDRIGLQVGTLNKKLEKVLVALDVTDEVVEEAIEAQAGLIIAHHAVIFRPLKALRTDLPGGKLLEKLIKHDIAVYIAHTNLDIAEGGVNDMLADALALEDRQLLSETSRDPYRKLVVYVPHSHADAVSEALFQAGAGHIGAYSECSFQSEGTGTFTPSAVSQPFIGETGRREHVPEKRIETIVPAQLERQVIQAMRKAHPYEEPAFDLFPLELAGHAYGLGRIGKRSEPCTLRELIDEVKRVCEVPFVRFVGDEQQQVSKIAVLGGSGGRYLAQAQFAGADVMITGDVDYHAAHDAWAAGMSVIDPGHNIEKIMKKGVAERVGSMLQEQGYTTAILPSTVNTEVFKLG